MTLDQIVRQNKHLFNTAKGNMLEAYDRIIRKKVSIARAYQQIGEKTNVKWRELERTKPKVAERLAKLIQPPPPPPPPPPPKEQPKEEEKKPAKKREKKAISAKV